MIRQKCRAYVTPVTFNLSDKSAAAAQKKSNLKNLGIVIYAHKFNVIPSGDCVHTACVILAANYNMYIYVQYIISRLSHNVYVGPKSGVHMTL